jgi:hypothetical protein
MSSKVIEGLIKSVSDLEARVARLEERVGRLERERAFAGPAEWVTVYEEGGYVVLRGGLFGEYVVVTPEGERLPYASLKSAIALIKSRLAAKAKKGGK